MVPCNLLPLQRTPLPSDNSLSKFSYFAPYDTLITVVEWIINMFGCIVGAPEVDLQVVFEYVLAFASDPTRVAVPHGDNFLDYTPAGYRPGYESEEEDCYLTECFSLDRDSCDVPCCHYEADDGKVWFNPCSCISDGDCRCQDNAAEPDSITSRAHDCIAKDFPCVLNSDCCQYENKEMLCRKRLDDGILEETGVCEEAQERPFGWNPFCVAWNFPIDELTTFGFTFAKPFPPLVVDP